MASTRKSIYINRLYSFSISAFLEWFLIIQTNDGEFKGTAAIAIDKDNFIYVTDLGNKRVQKFDDDGNFIAKWGVDGSGNGEFLSPRGITIDMMGNIFVTDTSQRSIQKFNITALTKHPNIQAAA